MSSSRRLLLLGIALTIASLARRWLADAPVIDVLRVHEPGDDVTGCPTDLALRNYTGDLTGILTSYRACQSRGLA